MTNRTSRSASMSSSGSPATAMMSAARPGANGPRSSLVFGAGVAVDRHDLEDLGGGDARGLPRLQEVDHHLAARHPGDVVVGVRRERELHAVLVGVLEPGDGRLESVRASAVLGKGRLGAGAPDSLGRHHLVKLVVEHPRVRQRPESGLDRPLAPPHGSGCALRPCMPARAASWTKSLISSTE